MFLGKCLRENQRGNRWTQGGEREGGRTSGKPLDAGRGRRRRENQRGNRWTQGGEGGGTSGETAGRREGKGKEGGRRRANSYKYNNQKKRRDYD